MRLDWFQVAGFVEGGRVAGEYDFDGLFSDWKFEDLPRQSGIETIKAVIMVKKTQYEDNTTPPLETYVETQWEQSTMAPSDVFTTMGFSKIKLNLD